MAIDYILVGLFGALIGLSELLSKYRESPFQAILIRNLASWFYIIINVLAAMGALWIIRVFDITFGLTQTPEQIRWSQVLIAGFGAVIFFRSSFFNFPVGEEEISIGPSSVMQVFLSYTSLAVAREIDRDRTQNKADIVRAVMQGVSFEKANEVLPVLSIALNQHLHREEQEKIAEDIARIENTIGLSDRAKALLLGVTLIDKVGEEAFTQTVQMLEEEIVNINVQPD